MILQYCRDWRATSSWTLDETRGGSFWSGPVVTPSAQQLSFKCEASFKIHYDVILIMKTQLRYNFKVRIIITLLVRRYKKYLRMYNMNVKVKLIFLVFFRL